jgi:uncharacterized cupredoxin-like copper-binding protein
VSFVLNQRASRRALLGAAVAVVSTFALVGCGSSSGTGASKGTVVGVTERDFRISAPKTVSAGDITLRVHNEGPDAHELIVVRAGSVKLPMRSDGLTVSEERLQHREAGSLEPGQPRVIRDLHVHLTPGRYVLFCNMSGHFRGGMHVVLTVK